MSTAFWAFQLRTSWSNLDALPPTSRLRSFVRLARQMRGRHQSACATPLVGADAEAAGKLTVILMNHKRPENVALIARYVLRSGFVSRLVISNNSQAYPIARYVPFHDERLVLLDQERPSGVGIRFELARRYPARYYLAIDDDIFLHPAQLQWIYERLCASDEQPHGIFGAAWSPAESPSKEWPFVHRRGADVPVDILNGLFAFTAGQLQEYFRLCGVLGIDDPSSLMNGEDIILSFSGSRRPRIHNIGPIWECASASTPGVALHVSRPRFYEERWSLLSRLREAKPLAPQ